MLENSCTIYCLAKAYAMDVNRVHSIALSQGINCEIEGLNFYQTVKVNTILSGIKKPIYNKLLAVYNHPDFHCIVAVDDISYWCHNRGFLPKLPIDYLPHHSICLLYNEYNSITNTPKRIMQFCNASCPKRITTRTVEKWFKTGLPFERAQLHIRESLKG